MAKTLKLIVEITEGEEGVQTLIHSESDHPMQEFGQGTLLGASIIKRAIEVAVRDVHSIQSGEVNPP